MTSPGRPSDPEETSSPSDGRLDEVGVAVGPDRDALGLFDAPNTEGTATSEHTVGAEPLGQPDQRRTAVLAWIAAQPSDPPRAPVPDAPSAAIKRLIADEPMDRLPALDGLPARPRPPSVAPPPPEREDTATQIVGLDAALRGPDPESPPAEPPRRAVPGPVPMLVVALLALAAAWILLSLR